MALDRNIVTVADSARKRAVQMREHLNRMGTTSPTLGVGVSADKALQPDEWYQRLMKYIPGEALSHYLTRDSLVRSASLQDKVAVWLGVVLAVAITFNLVYLVRVWRIRRLSQIAISTGALVVYVFAMGGVFKETMWWEPFQGALALVITTAFLSFFKPPGQQDVVAELTDTDTRRGAPT
jgi:hypothetical protein